MLPSNLGDSASPSVQPFSGTWQVSHDIFLVFESRLSKKSCSPSLSLPAVIGLSAGTSIGWSCNPRGNVKAGLAWARTLSTRPPIPPATTAPRRTALVRLIVLCLLVPGNRLRALGRASTSPADRDETSGVQRGVA